MDEQVDERVALRIRRASVAIGVAGGTLAAVFIASCGLNVAGLKRSLPFWAVVVVGALALAVLGLAWVIHRIDSLRARSTSRQRAAESRFDAILAAAPDAILVIDPEGRILVANRQAEFTFGYDPGELVGRPVDSLVPMNCRGGHAEHRKDFHAAPAIRTMAARRAVTALRKDGSEFPAEIALSPLAEGNHTLVTAIVRDISERLKIEQQMRQSQKMEAVGQLAGGIAHDFNNMLTVIGGYADIMALRLAEGRPDAAPLEEIRRAARRSAALTQQLLAFSRRQVLQPKTLHLDTLVAGVEPMLRRLLGEDIDLRVVRPSGLGRVRADHGQIEQVVLNLAINGRDAMPRGGKLTMETSDVELDEAYANAHPGVKPGPHVLLSVTDTGVGMDAATLDRIFEPFFSTKGERGTGLGLATVHGIVNQSGGHIWVYSEPGHGTTFKVYLPRVSELEQPSTPRVRLPAPVGGTELVLVVEDEPSIRSLVSTVLQERGYMTLEAAGAEEALQAASGRETTIHLLLTDIVLRGRSGPQLAHRMRAANPRLRVLYMSGYTENAVVHRGELDEGVEYLQKPFTPEALARRVRSVLDA